MDEVLGWSRIGTPYAFGLEASDAAAVQYDSSSVRGTRMNLPLRGYEERSLIERSIRKFDFYLVTISKEHVRLAARKAEFDFIRGALVARPLGRRTWTPNLIRLRNRISPH